LKSAVIDSRKWMNDWNGKRAKVSGDANRLSVRGKLRRA